MYLTIYLPRASSQNRTDVYCLQNSCSTIKLKRQIGLGFPNPFKKKFMI